MATFSSPGKFRTPMLHHRRDNTEESNDHSEGDIYSRQLLPGIPCHIAQLCLSRVTPSKLFPVCRSWRRLIYSDSFPPFNSIYALFHTADPRRYLSTTLQLFSFDPISQHWLAIPHPPIKFLLRHPSFISRKLPIQSVSVNGKLILLAATNDDFQPALTHPLIFDPLSKEWTKGPDFSTPRRWCATGATQGSVYIASGVGVKYKTEVARSVEKWDLNAEWKWEKLENLKDGKFSRDEIEAVGFKGKLCMVNVKGDGAKEGVIYDLKKDCWEDMPEGMISGWRGPTAAMSEERIFAVDESRGCLKVYDDVQDKWTEVMEDEILKGALQVTAEKCGKICVLCSDGVRIAVVDVAAPESRVWVVESPPRLQALSIHVLPRVPTC